MRLKPLPSVVRALLEAQGAPPRLVAHLTLVHDVAGTLIAGVDNTWPLLNYDRAAVLFGAATHDIGKTVYREELSGPGKRHEAEGLKILTESGFPESHARFAWTHGGPSREADPSIEDLLVRLSDSIWKGVRGKSVEMELCDKISTACAEARWSTYMKLDDLLCHIAASADERLLWQSLHPID